MLRMIEGTAFTVYSLALVISILKEIIANWIVKILLQLNEHFLSY